MTIRFSAMLDHMNAKSITNRRKDHSIVAKPEAKAALELTMKRFHVAVPRPYVAE